MKIGVRYEEAELYVELTTAESETLGTILIDAMASDEANAEKFGDRLASLMDAILPLIGVETTEEEKEPEEVDPEPEEEKPSKQAEKVLIPCRTWKHRGTEDKFKFVRTWLQRRKIPFKDECGYSGNLYITYELTTAQFERLQTSLKESFGDDFDTEVTI